MKKTDDSMNINATENRQAKQRSNAKRTALLVGLIALLVYGGFLASVMIEK